MYEHSTRVPFIAVGPGIRQGVKIETPIYLQDVHPTTLELAGAKPADKVEFKSLMPLLQARPTGLPTMLFTVLTLACSAA